VLSPVLILVFLLVLNPVSIHLKDPVPILLFLPVLSPVSILPKDPVISPVIILAFLLVLSPVLILLKNLVINPPSNLFETISNGLSYSNEHVILFIFVYLVFCFKFYRAVNFLMCIYNKMLACITLFLIHVLYFGIFFSLLKTTSNKFVCPSFRNFYVCLYCA
jgi:hypothetical protein